MRQKPDLVVVTGIAGITANALKTLRESGIKVANYLTDDPWNQAHYAPWFLKALPEYFAIFSPRHANLADLRNLGCRRVSFLPFAYEPELHFPELPTENEREKFATDVLFIGGADTDRIPVCEAIIEAGVSLSIYGDYWDCSQRIRPFWKGYADPAALRKATGTAKVCLCLTRKANRDGHTMRSYELPAMGGVILAEATNDHLETFGEDGALYFEDTSEMVTKAKWLIEHPVEAKNMADRAHARVVSGTNTYGDRLETIRKATLPE